MMPRHPFEWLSRSAQKRAFVPLLVLTLAVMAGLRALDSPLKTGVAPSGIVSFEFAGELALARSILESWEETGRVSAGMSLGLDYLFLVAYATTIALACVLVAGSLAQPARPLSPVGMCLAWAQLCAALLDCVENYALIRVLLGSQRELWPAVAHCCAIPKFLIVVLGLAYVCIGALAAMLAQVRGREGRAATDHSPPADQGPAGGCIFKEVSHASSVCRLGRGLQVRQGPARQDLPRVGEGGLRLRPGRHRAGASAVL